MGRYAAWTIVCLAVCTTSLLAAAPAVGAGTLDLGSGSLLHVLGTLPGQDDRFAASSMAAAGDVNGDGRPDLLIGASGASPFHRRKAGKVLVIFGRAGARTINARHLGADGFQIFGAPALLPLHDQDIDITDRAGSTVAPAGDVNGDGLADVIVSAPGASNNFRAASGSVYVVFGQRSTDPVDLAHLGAGGYRIDGAQSSDFAGARVVGVGDANGDGRPDLALVSSRGLYVIYGQIGTATIDLGHLRPDQGFRIALPRGYDQGASLAAAGDVNGDGRTDLIIGLPEASPRRRLAAGSAYVVLMPAGPVDLSLDHLGAHGFRIDGSAAGDHAGTAVALLPGAAGGRAAAVLTAPGASRRPGGGFDAGDGKAYVVLAQSTSGAVDLGHLGTGGYSILSPRRGIEFGNSVAALPDLNRDGTPDLVVGAPSRSAHCRASAGAAYVVYGRSGPGTIDLARPRWPGFEIDGAYASQEAGGLLASLGDFNRDGHPDLLVGASGHSPQVFPGPPPTPWDAYVLSAQPAKLARALGPCLSVRVPSTTLRQVLSTGALAVSVASRGTGALDVSVAPVDGVQAFPRAVRVTFRRPGTRTVRVPLDRAAGKALSGRHRVGLLVEADLVGELGREITDIERATAQTVLTAP